MPKNTLITNSQIMIKIPRVTRKLFIYLFYANKYFNIKKFSLLILRVLTFRQNFYERDGNSIIYLQ